MLTTMIIVFLIGYLLIALEHPLKINKGEQHSDWNNPFGFIYIGTLNLFRPLQPKNLNFF